MTRSKRAAHAVALPVLAMLLTVSTAATACAAPAEPDPGPSPDGLPPGVAQAVGTAWERYGPAADQLDPGDGYPRSVEAGGDEWETTPAADWTSGFFPGTLWLAAELTGDPAWRPRAQRWTAPLAGEATRTDTHDLGFVIDDSFGAEQRVTGSPEAARVEQTGAGSLATRFDPKVKAIKSWDTEGDDDKRKQWRYPVIADNLMNLDLLYRAAAMPGGDPAWARVATEHALTASRTNSRPDGSVAHVALFDPDTGAFQGRETWQGAAPDSTWSRGQGWAIHGYTTAARASGDPTLRAAATRAADWWLAHVPPDGVPAWDFSKPTEERDTSAAAVAAAGLIDLADLTGDRRYREAAGTAMSTLAQRFVAPEGPALLAHAVGGRPQGSEIDVGLVYGDHYFLEAARRWQEGIA